MAPKTKQEVKAREKVADDKTFGLKNKNRSKQVQKFVAQVKATAIHGNVRGGATAEVAKKKEESNKKDQAAKAAALYAQLFGGTVDLKKGIVKAETEVKSKTNEETKAEQRINWYVDIRDQRNVEPPCSEWSDQQIRDYVVEKLANASTSIICKHYLEAVKTNVLGWFWKCPNGGDECKYLHFLLPGTSLNKKDKIDGEDDDDEPIDEKLERERAALPPGGEPVTMESFMKWKARKEEERINAIKAELAVAEGKKKGGHKTTEPVLSGKDLFTFNPDLFVDDDGAVGADQYEEDKTYWEEIQKQNQAVLDKANDDALALALEEGTEGVFAEDDDVDLDDLEDD